VSAPRTAVIVYDGFQLLDLAGPVDVLRAATLLGARPGYDIVLASPGGEPVRSESGLGVAVDGAVADLVRRPPHTLLVVGGLGSRAAAADAVLCRQLGRLAPKVERVASVCTGALVLAAAGLLDGYRATTHWASCAELAESRPGVEVEPDRIFVHDRDRWTSAGVTAGIDLALALVEADHGAELAHRVAAWLVVFVRRPGGQHQFSAQLRAQPAGTPAIAELQRWLPDHLDADLSVEALARRAGMSGRSFARHFAQETGATPAAHVESLRVEAARRLLEASDLTVAAIARAVGLRHAETLHRAFQRRLGTSPDRYRQHFARRAS
jgi:transcriptional regulator GlxA family with amidase domain